MLTTDGHVGLGKASSLAVKTVTPRVDVSLWESMVDHIVIDRWTKKNDGFGVFNVHIIGLLYCNTMMVIIHYNSPISGIHSIGLSYCFSKIRWIRIVWLCQCLSEDCLIPRPVTSPFSKHISWHLLVISPGKEQNLQMIFPSQNGEKIHNSSWFSHEQTSFLGIFPWFSR